MDKKGTLIIVSALTIGAGAIGFELGKMYVVNTIYKNRQAQIRQGQIKAWGEAWARECENREETSE